MSVVRSVRAWARSIPTLSFGVPRDVAFESTAAAGVAEAVRAEQGPVLVVSDFGFRFAGDTAPRVRRVRDGATTSGPTPTLLVVVLRDPSHAQRVYSHYVDPMMANGRTRLLEISAVTRGRTGLRGP